VDAVGAVTTLTPGDATAGFAASAGTSVTSAACAAALYGTPAAVGCGGVLVSVGACGTCVSTQLPGGTPAAAAAAAKAAEASCNIPLGCLPKRRRSKSAVG
jgi:hypothetical protein